MAPHSQCTVIILQKKCMFYLVIKLLGVSQWSHEYLSWWVCTSDLSHSVQAVQSLSRVRLFATPRIAARQASLSITDSRSLLKLMSIELVMPSSHLILCCPLLLLPPIPPSIRVFSNESTLHIRWPEYWRFSFSISPSNEHPHSGAQKSRRHCPRAHFESLPSVCFYLWVFLTFSIHTLNWDFISQAKLVHFKGLL